MANRRRCRLNTMGQAAGPGAPTETTMPDHTLDNWTALKSGALADTLSQMLERLGEAAFLDAFDAPAALGEDAARDGRTAAPARTPAALAGAAASSLAVGLDSPGRSPAVAPPLAAAAAPLEVR